jgi:hypothetical protein
MEISSLTLKKTKLVYYTLIVLNLLFLMLVLAFWGLKLPTFKLEKQLAYIVSTLAILLIGVLITGGFFFFSKMRKKVAFIDPSEYKLSAFFKASVLQFAFFNLAGNVAIMAFLFTQDLQNLFFYLITLVFLFFNPPAMNRLSVEFKYRVADNETQEIPDEQQGN